MTLAGPPGQPLLATPGGRVENLAGELRRWDLGAALVVGASARDPDLAAFVGSIHLGTSFLVIPVEGDPRLGYLTAMERREAADSGLDLLRPEELEVARLGRAYGTGSEFWVALLERAFELSGLAPCAVALGGRYPAGPLHEACVELETRGWRFVAGHDLLRRCRRTKTVWELDQARAAATGVCDAFHRIAAVLSASEPLAGRLLLAGEPLTAGRLRQAAAEAVAEHGLEQPEGNIIATGADAAAPHTQGDSGVALAPGVPIVVDLYPRGTVFADCTRTFCRGEPPVEVSGAHHAVDRALRLARERAAAGVPAWELQRAVCELFSEEGYPTPITTPGTEVGYVHGLGHGVGLELHELPSFKHEAGDEGCLAIGDLITLEPGLYDEARGYGVRLEDLCYVGPDGLEVLTPLPYDLDPLAWEP